MIWSQIHFQIYYNMQTYSIRPPIQFDRCNTNKKIVMYLWNWSFAYYDYRLSDFHLIIITKVQLKKFIAFTVASFVQLLISFVYFFFAFSLRWNGWSSIPLVHINWIVVFQFAMLRRFLERLTFCQTTEIEMLLSNYEFLSKFPKRNAEWRSQKAKFS